jgi:hypothetical protein
MTSGALVRDEYSSSKSLLVVAVRIARHVGRVDDELDLGCRERVADLGGRADPLAIVAGSV